MEQAVLFERFTHCMAAFVHAKPAAGLAELSLDEWKALYRLARRQSLTGALCTVTDPSSIPVQAKERLQRDGFLMLATYETQTACIRDIAVAFEKNGLPHLFFKGAVIRNYYKQPAMRSMGDIDMAIKAEDAERAHETMTAAGFERIERAGEVWVYRRDGQLVEMHTVVRQYNVNEQDTVPYETLWADAVADYGTTYRLIDEAEAAHTVAHLAAHFCAGGCGLRQLMDVAVLCERFPEEAFWEDVLERLRPLGADTFAKHLLYLCERWFAVRAPQTAVCALTAEAESGMRERLLSDGTFGADERLMLASMRKERRLQKQGGAVGQKLRWIFPKPAYIRRHYPYAARTPLLLPIAYGHRLLDGVTKNRRLHEERMRYAEEQKDLLGVELAFFEEIGL